MFVEIIPHEKHVAYLFDPKFIHRCDSRILKVSFAQRNCFIACLESILAILFVLLIV